ncbi:hypothetical protein [Peloplasma aerotolerans]|uniref:Uncharacterized protein n=1 Tax=Peloplasma aerotolerans TaxID=3044389 RepID=A0AAW6U6S8_9MOLU|nr:hypothetical protein [Mariniplasma sp. M4Ah]MDI6453540.1 hypothetical protein [Mariniplasma sp. M4Ah]MDR4969349.1 hypothetical protein [Acholeplasmataceae bacterium]
MVEKNPLFGEKRLLIHKQKAIPKSDKTAFSNIITLYACNLELLKFFLKEKVVLSHENKILRGKSKIDYYRRYRPDDDTLKEYLELIRCFWINLIDHTKVVKEYMEKSIDDSPALDYRNSEGGNLLFRPIGQVPFVQTAIKIYSLEESWECVFAKLKEIPFELGKTPWVEVVWNSINKKMLTRGRDKLIKQLMFYMSEKTFLSNTEIQDMIKNYRASKQLDDDYDVLEEINRSIIIDFT